MARPTGTSPRKARSVAPSTLFLSAITILELERGTLVIERRDQVQVRDFTLGWTPACSRLSRAEYCPSIPPSRCAVRDFVSPIPERNETP
jgi:hypothetical protein